jgi:hypothetical protein
VEQGRRKRIVLGGLMGITLLMASCGRSCGRHPQDNIGLGSSNPTEGPFFLSQPITFCWERPLNLRRGTAQILVDSSGSMTGFSHAIPPLVTWIEHGISQVQQSSMEVENSRLCQFNQRIGIAECTPSGKQPSQFRAFGNTNLHDAIRAAKDYGLTFILTDGVAATGGQGAGDCANGVDAACVARSLKEVVHDRATTGEGLDTGIWVMPLLANYDGVFYTEEQIVPADFRPEETIKQVRVDVETEAVIQNPHTGSDGRLEFNYRGPRALLLIVIARWSDVGRNAVQALWERSEYLSVRRIEEMKRFSSGTATFSPIELYPGFLNQVKWKTLQEPQNPSEAKGTMDAALKADPKYPTIGITCPQRDTGEGVYKLSGISSEAGRVSGCAPIRMLPAFDFQFRTARAEDENALSRFLTSYQRSGDSYTELRLNLACTMSNPRPCASNPVTIQWTAFMNYMGAADGLASSDDSHPVQQQIKNISTVSPSREPHRIFAFSTTLEDFYREVGQDQRSIILADLNICHGP